MAQSDSVDMTQPNVNQWQWNLFISDWQFFLIKFCHCYLLSAMHFFHPHFLSTSTLQSALEPCSEWVKPHTAEVAQLTAISDLRTSSLNFLALKHATEAAMEQSCITIKWVAKGGANQVCLLPLLCNTNTNRWSQVVLDYFIWWTTTSCAYCIRLPASSAHGRGLFSSERWWSHTDSI